MIAWLVLAGGPRASAQTTAQAGATWQPMVSDEKINTLSTEKWLELEKKNQQTWKVSKGKDFKQLPPEFQWDEAPSPIDTPFPIYPTDLLKKGVAGHVRVVFAVAPDGSTYGAQLDEVSAPEFGEAVLAMVDACRFNPAKKDGKPGYAFLGSEYQFNPTGRSDGKVSPEARFILRDLKKNPDSVASLSQLDQPLKPVKRKPPVYPSALKEAQPAGSAEVEFFVDTDGKVQLPRIVSSSAPAFGYAVVQAVSSWRFEPPKRGGKPVVVRASMPIDFAGKPAAGAAK